MLSVHGTPLRALFLVRISLFGISVMQSGDSVILESGKDEAEFGRVLSTTYASQNYRPNLR
jgi:hypothetical protein